MNRQDYDNIMQSAQNRNVDIVQTGWDHVAEWGCDLSTRKLRIDEDGASEVDALALFVELARNHEVIILPSYECARPVTLRSDEIVIKENRHGQVTSLTSNQSVFSAGITILDHNVMTTDKVGQFRTFMLTDLRGNMDVNRWGEIRIVSENSNIPDTISITQMVNPGRCTSVYGRAYLAAKTMVMRLVDQAQDLRRQIKDMPQVDREAAEYGVHTGDAKVVEVEAFEVELDGLVLSGEYRQYPRTLDGRAEAERDLKEINKLLKMLRFLTRMSEKAFFDHAVLPKLGGSIGGVMTWQDGGVEGSPMVPQWCSGQWTTGYKPSTRARNKWARIEVQPGIYLRARAWLSKEKISAAYE